MASEHLLDYSIIGLYLLLLLALGVYVAKLSTNVSDYLRGGAQGTWWLVGTSTFMGSFSAYTFTANGGLAYQAGLTPVAIFLGIAGGLLAAAIFVGPWIRQSRALTAMDIVRERFGPEVEQFCVYIGIVNQPVSSAIQLWALCFFCSTIFGLPLQPTIIVVGCVVVFYSTVGGRWAVMMTDFLQGLVLVPVTLLIAWLCVRELGGFDALLGYFSDPRFRDDFAFVKPDGQFPDNKFGWQWIVAMFLIVFCNEVSFNQAPKYLSVKDGAGARRAALLSMGLMLLGGIIFLLPAVTARILHPDLVAASPLANPAESAYAVAAMQVLPQGLTGILVVAMFAATMTGMDLGLNTAAGVVVTNLAPPLCRRLGLPAPSARWQLPLCMLLTVALGGFIVGVALLLARAEKMDIFGAFTLFQSVIAVPMSQPFVLGLFIKRLPRWSYFFLLACGLSPTAWELAAGQKLVFQEKMLWIFGLTLAGAGVCRLAYPWSSAAYKARVEGLFQRMRTPVNYAAEVGADRDIFQLELMGRTAVIGGGLLALLLFVPNSAGDRLGVAFLAGFVAAVGGLLILVARRRRRCAADAKATPVQ
jgi:SSS family solute:Na+ symporter